MKPGNIPHQIIKSVACYFSCRIKVNAAEFFHNLGMVRNFKDWHRRLPELFNLDITAVVLSNRNGRVDDVWNRHHDSGDFFRKLLFLLLQLGKAGCICCNLRLNLLRLFLLSLCHQRANLLGNLIFICTQGVCLCLRSAGFCIQLNHFIHKCKLVFLEFLFNIFLYCIRIFP